MNKTRTQPARSAKIGGSPFELPATGPMRAIVCVSADGHVPAGMTVRSRIDGQMFTAEFDAALLDSLAADPEVVSIAPAQVLPPVTPRRGP